MKRTPIKGRKHRRTQATDIPQSVKDAVFKRDQQQCVWCGSARGMPEAHFIPRSKGGLGIEQNILTLCRVGFNDGRMSCHDEFDKGTKEQRETMSSYFWNYLCVQYPGLKKEDLIYRRVP